MRKPHHYQRASSSEFYLGRGIKDVQVKFNGLGGLARFACRLKGHDWDVWDISDTGWRTVEDHRCKRCGKHKIITGYLMQD